MMRRRGGSQGSWSRSTFREVQGLWGLWWRRKIWFLKSSTLLWNVTLASDGFPFWDLTPTVSSFTAQMWISRVWYFNPIVFVTKLVLFESIILNLRTLFCSTESMGSHRMLWSEEFCAVQKASVPIKRRRFGIRDGTSKAKPWLHLEVQVEDMV